MSNEPSDTSEIILTSTGFTHRRIIETNLGTQEHCLAQIMDAQAHVVRNILHTQYDQPVHLSVSKQSLVLTTRWMKDLPFLTTFMRASNGDFVPTWHKAHEIFPGEIYNTEPYPLAFLGGDLLFGLAFTIAENGRTEIQDVHLGLVPKGKKEAMHFSYPNHYTNGKFCMGANWRDHAWGPRNRENILEAFDHALTSFATTSCNADLTTENTIRFMFRKDGDGHWRKPDDAQMKSVLLPLSSLVMNQMIAAYGNNT